MLALQFDGQLQVTRTPRPTQAGEALIKLRLAGICNTDIEITRGYGQFKGILGHEFVGEVVASPDKDLLGKRVVGEINVGCGDCVLCQTGNMRHCAKRNVLGIVSRNGAFAEYLSLPSRNLLVVPANIPDEIAVFAEPLAAACEIIHQVDIRSYHQVAVIGDGKLGLLIAQVLKLTGCALTVIGKHPEKLAVAAQFGIATQTIEGLNIAANSLDYIVEASGSATGMALALDLAKPCGHIILKSTYAGQLSLDASRIVVKELTLIGSRCGSLEVALKLLATEQIDPRPLISSVFTLKKAVSAIQYAQQPGILKVLLQP